MANGPKLAAVSQAAHPAGVADPLFVSVPDNSDLPFAGWQTPALMHHLEFTSLYSYAAEPEGISILISLKVGVKTVSPVASVDTGASFCIFRDELAELLEALRHLPW